MGGGGSAGFDFAGTTGESSTRAWRAISKARAFGDSTGACDFVGVDGTLPPLPDSSWPLMMVPWRRRMPRGRRRMPRGRSAVSRRELTRTLMYHTHRGGLRGLAAALLLSLLGRSIAHGSCCIAGFPSPTSRARRRARTRPSSFV